MVREINGLGGPYNTPTSTERSARKTPDAAENQPKASSGSTQDQVQLSNAAINLQALADRVNDLPEVNIERAEKIKAALENGEYRIDDLVLADKILNTEALLGK
jgi:negative regulator of flagellin synthesis FlgM